MEPCGSYSPRYKVSSSSPCPHAFVFKETKTRPKAPLATSRSAPRTAAVRPCGLARGRSYSQRCHPPRPPAARRAPPPLPRRSRLSEPAPRPSSRSGTGAGAGAGAGTGAGRLGAVGAAGRLCEPRACAGLSPAAGTAAWPLLPARAAERLSESAGARGSPAAAAGDRKAARRKWQRRVPSSPPARGHGLRAPLRDRRAPRAPPPPPRASERRRQRSSRSSSRRWAQPVGLPVQPAGFWGLFLQRQPQLFSGPNLIGLNATVERSTAALTQPVLLKKKKLLYK